jgi:hypothetical protein
MQYYIVYYIILYILHHIVQCTMPYIILYNTIWYIRYFVLYSSYGECNVVRRGGQASSSIVSIHLSLDKDYGIIIPYWNKGGNNVGNIEATFFS